MDPETGEQRKNKYDRLEFEDRGVTCECVMRRAFDERMKNAMIPDEFEGCRFDNYLVDKPIQKAMRETVGTYLKNFKDIMNTQRNSLGFHAVVGEMAIKSLPVMKRGELKKKHNSYGLGKTHLQTAAAKWIMKNVRIEEDGYDRGCRVLYVSDKNFMDDLMLAKRSDDNNESYHKLLNMVLSADVLVWDDLGKSNHTEAKEDTYYLIINDFYKKRKPIIWSSNECENTLGEKIGYAAADRILGMSVDYLLAVEGDSFRLKDL